MAEQEVEQQEVTIKQLLQAGAHFGHQTYRWNPKMRPYIYEARNGIHVIDLAKTLHQLRVAVDMVRKVIREGKSILFVGTKKQAKAVVKELAELCGEFYVAERWLGGMLTNLSTIRLSVKKLDRIEKNVASEAAEGYTKKELSQMVKLQEKLDRNLSGVRAMRKVPGLLVVVDPGKEHIAVAEANKLGIPVMGLVDTNTDPRGVQHVIPCNDDALKSVRLILQALAFTALNEKKKMNVLVEKEGKPEEEEAAVEVGVAEEKENG